MHIFNICCLKVLKGKMKTFYFIFLLIGLNLNLHLSHPIDDEEDYLKGIDEDQIIDLSEIDPKIFGTENRGEARIKWTPESGINPEEIGGYYEGDILIDINSRAAATKKTTLWPGGIVPYELSEDLSDDDVAQINNCIALYNQNTCIKFQERAGETDYIFIKNDSPGCFSALGRKGGYQHVNLGEGCTYKVGTVCHEFMHTLGFFHEHMRDDRDKWVKIDFANILTNSVSNFNKLNSKEATNYGIDYNYGSVMHYPASAFPKSKGLITIKALVG